MYVYMCVHQLMEQEEVAVHMTGKKRRKVVFDQDEDSASDGENVSVDESHDIDAVRKGNRVQMAI